MFYMFMQNSGPELNELLHSHRLESLEITQTRFRSSNSWTRKLQGHEAATKQQSCLWLERD